MAAHTLGPISVTYVPAPLPTPYLVAVDDDADVRVRPGTADVAGDDLNAVVGRAGGVGAASQQLPTAPAQVVTLGLWVRGSCRQCTGVSPCLSATQLNCLGVCPWGCCGTIMAWHKGACSSFQISMTAEAFVSQKADPVGRAMFTNLAKPGCFVTARADHGSAP